MARDDTSAETKVRLLRAATEVFAEEGYRKATLREICRRASANIAAVNYHYGDKEQLYAAVIDRAIAAAEEARPRVEADCAAEHKLRNFVHDILKSLLGAGRPAQLLKLISNEMVEPTPALDRMIETAMRPVNRAICSIVAELLGPDARPELVRECASSIMAQCVIYDHSRAVVERMHHLNLHDEAMIEYLTDHITRFSLGGLQALAGELQASAGAKTAAL